MNVSNGTKGIVDVAKFLQTAADKATNLGAKFRNLLPAKIRQELAIAAKNSKISGQPAKDLLEKTANEQGKVTVHVPAGELNYHIDPAMNGVKKP